MTASRVNSPWSIQTLLNNPNRTNLHQHASRMVKGLSSPNESFTHIWQFHALGTSLLFNCILYTIHCIYVYNSVYFFARAHDRTFLDISFLNYHFFWWIAHLKHLGTRNPLAKKVVLLVLVARFALALHGKHKLNFCAKTCLLQSWGNCPCYS